MLPRLLRRLLAHDAMVTGAGLTLRTGWRQSRHERVRLGHAWGMLQGTAAVNIGQLRTPGPGGPPARTLSPGPGRPPCYLWHARGQTSAWAMGVAFHGAYAVGTDARID
jgi:hypothetical protein